MPRVDIRNQAEREVVPGFFLRVVHSDHVTNAFWRIVAGASLDAHSHPHEQIVNMIEGTFELVVAGQPHRLEAGDVFVIPGNIPHGGRAISDCRIIDSFYPVREDLR